MTAQSRQTNWTDNYWTDRQSSSIPATMANCTSSTSTQRSNRWPQSCGEKPLSNHPLSSISNKNANEKSSVNTPVRLVKLIWRREVGRVPAKRITFRCVSITSGPSLSWQLVALVQENCVAFNSMHTSAASQCARRCKRARLLAADHRACPRGGRTSARGTCRPCSGILRTG